MPEISDEWNRRAAERAHDLVNDLGKLVGEASARDVQEAIKTALLINSGAAVAVLGKQRRNSPAAGLHGGGSACA